jgi:hypothetical protein
MPAAGMLSLLVGARGLGLSARLAVRAGWRAGVEQVALALADQHLQPRPALAQLADVADVVEVVVGEQHVRRLEPGALGRLDQGRHRAAGVDEERRPSLAVGHQVGVGHELGVAGGLDEHGAILTRTRPAPPARPAATGR